MSNPGGSLPCPDCGSATKVIDSRPNGLGIKRRRQCTSCGIRFSTQEFISEAGFVQLAKDPVVNEVQQLLRERSDKGLKKYGTGLDRGDLDYVDWLNHAQEEALDFSLYLQVLKRLAE